MNILVLCTGNSCRSQIAEAYLRFFTEGKVDVYSAGIEKHGVNPMAVNVLKEDGIDISSHKSNLVDDYININFDYIITVCDNAKEACPFFPGTARRIHQSFPDPAKTKGTIEEINNEFILVRDQIKQFCKDFANRLTSTGG